MRRTFGVRNTTRDERANPKPESATSVKLTSIKGWLGAGAMIFAFQVNAAQAQVATSGNRAMPGLVHLGAPIPDDRSVAVAAGVGLGWLDRAQNSTGGSRITGQLAASVDVLPSLTLGADFLAYRDGFGAETNGSGEPRVSSRYIGAGLDEHAWGFQLDSRFVASRAVRIPRKPAALAAGSAWISRQPICPGSARFASDSRQRSAFAQRKYLERDPLGFRSWLSTPARYVPVGGADRRSVGRRRSTWLFCLTLASQRRGSANAR